MTNWRNHSGQDKQMQPRVTLHDLAREAGVSPATVDRVLNNRDGVRARTRDVVLQTATRLGYISDGDLPALQAPGVKPVKLLFLLPMGTNTFIKSLHQQIEQQSATRPDLSVTVEAVEGFDPQTFAKRLAQAQGVVDGVGIVAQDHPMVREAIRQLAQSEIPVVTMVSDIQNVPRLAYIGIDNRQAGRLAGQLMGRLIGGQAPAKLALFAGSLAYRGHEEREMGFRHIIREEFPHLQIVEFRESREDRTIAAAETETLLTAHPDLAGIYNVGGATGAIAQVIKARGMAKKIVLIGHEATQGNTQLLLEGTLDAVIDQIPRVEAREALNVLAAAARGTTYAYIPPRLQLILKENLPNE